MYKYIFSVEDFLCIKRPISKTKSPDSYTSNSIPTRVKSVLSKGSCSTASAQIFYCFGGYWKINDFTIHRLHKLKKISMILRWFGEKNNKQCKHHKGRFTITYGLTARFVWKSSTLDYRVSKWNYSPHLISPPDAHPLLSSWGYWSPSQPS